jgi:dTDP-4-dehydrorhamnose reductase
LYRVGAQRMRYTHRRAVERVVQGGYFVINCAAYTAVDRAETEVEAAHRVNAVGAENVAAACALAGVPLIHLSTDYIFGGQCHAPVSENDPPHPLNVYGRTKLDGEIAVRKLHRTHIIVRTSWIFSAHRENFVKTMLRLAGSQAQLWVVDDQVGGPTAADDIAKAILDIFTISTTPGFAAWGTYHFSGAPPVSRYEFARAIVTQSGAVVGRSPRRTFRVPLAAL